MNCCDCCHQEDPDLSPMLKDDVWQKLADKDEHLLGCECFYNRSIERRIPVFFADLLPCAFNLFHRPNSWFDLFLSGEPDTAVSVEWRQAMAFLRCV
jgi:hypothetical protein